MSSALIIPVMEEFIPQIAQIEKESFSSPWSEESLLNELSNPKAVMICALDSEDGTILGWAGFTFMFDEASVTNIAVKRDHRNKGIGTMLTKGIVMRAQELVMSSMMLEVRVSNLTAQGIYKKMGFEEIALRKNFYSFPREDGISMRIQL